MALPTTRRIHRLIALASAVVLASSACTGLLWAYSPYLYLDDGYMRKKAPIAGPRPTEAVVTAQEAMAATRQAGYRGQIQTVTLRSDFGRLLWEIQTRAGEDLQPFLMDAISAEKLSPLTPEQAAVIAGQYVRGQPPLEKVVFEERFLGRSDRARPAPAYRVSFRQAKHPEIVIHRDTGALLADEDTARRIHFFIANLHQLNYFGFRKTLTAVAGVPLLLLVVTGVFMWIRPRLRRARLHSKGAVAPG